jgi:hypothetical protein
MWVHDRGGDTRMTDWLLVLFVFVALTDYLN